MEIMMKISNQTLHEQVAVLIQEMIHSGELRRGQKINEILLSESMGVSRTPIREALRLLNSQGVVDLVPHKGAFVSQFSIKEIDDMFQVMAVLEGMCAELAAAKINDAGLKKLESLQKELERHYKAKDHKSYVQTNNKIHALIQDISGNDSINGVIKGLRQKILLFRYKQLYEPERFKKSIQEHRDLFKALQEKNPKKAKNVMKRHLLAQSKALVNLIEKKEKEEK
jgi:DNA-binding GntR family transcriptional regulator